MNIDRGNQPALEVAVTFPPGIALLSELHNMSSTRLHSQPNTFPNSQRPGTTGHLVYEIGFPSSEPRQAKGAALYRDQTELICSVDCFRTVGIRALDPRMGMFLGGGRGGVNVDRCYLLANLHSQVLRTFLFAIRWSILYVTMQVWFCVSYTIQTSILRLIIIYIQIPKEYPPPQF